MSVHSPTNEVRHKQLKESFKRNDINKFREVIAGLDGSERVKVLQASDAYAHQSIFELICATGDRPTFIRECILVGCDTNKVNQKCGKRPLGFAVEAISSTNSEALMSDTSVGVDVKHSIQFPFTPINYLVKLISNKNFDKIYSCIETLVKHCADVNLPTENGKTPIQNILENEPLDVDNKKKLVHCFLRNAKYVDVDEVRPRLIELLPDLELSPTHTQIDKEWNADRFFECLNNKNEIELLRGISFIAMNNRNRLTELFTIVYSNMTFLTLVIENAWKFSVEKIIRLSVDVNSKAGNFTPVEHAINTGHWEILKLLLSSSKFDLSLLQPILPTAALYTDRPTNNEKNYVKCFEILLNHSAIDVNAVDTLGYTALHYVIQYNDSKTIVDVLKRGAYIGIKDSLKKPLISRIDPQLLEKHFDSCITTTGKHSDQKEHELIFNLSNFIPSQPKLGKGRCCFRKRIYETEVLKQVSECKETKHLIRHPLVEGLLH
ncbi:hypothetical protein HA402_013473 [Bradysia odoriphaga]|nr:hypothetical protein HA402_013473 [Bradysia odoriphaga]